MEDKTLLVEKIKLEPKYITQSFKNEILNRLKQKVEGICSKHGYIVKGSIEIFKIAPGEIELIDLNGNVVYNVQFYADVRNPLVGSIIKNAKVVNLNRSGILADVNIVENNVVTSVLDIIIAKNSVNIISDIDLDNVKIGDYINVEVVGKKFKLGAKRISVIGKIIKEVREPLYKIADGNDDDDDDDIEADVEIPIDEEIEGEAEAEAEADIEEDDEIEVEGEIEEEKAGGSDFAFSEDEFAAEEEDVLDDGIDDGALSDAESI